MRRGPQKQLMRKNSELSNPVVIGGVGGSGTRVVAEIIKRLGFYIGDDLDSANDNLWFLLLFKRPRWFRRACHDRNNIITGLNLLSKAMLGQAGLVWTELQFLIRAVFEISIFGHNYTGDGRGFWPFVRAWKMIGRKQKTLSTYIQYGTGLTWHSVEISSNCIIGALSWALNCLSQSQMNPLHP